MLTADRLDALTDSISAIYEEYQQSVINDIARRLGKLKFDSAAWQMQRLTESGLTYQNALKELAKVTNKSEAELRRIFEKAGVTAMEFDDSIYKAAGLNPLPLNLSPAMAQVLAAGLAKTKNAMRNLTLTTALSAQQSFISAADLAYMQVANGAMSYDQAIRSAVKKLAADGVEVINYKSGRRDQLDVAMRRTVLTGVSQTTGQMQTTRAAEMGADLVQVSAHIGARPSHAAWQGKVFSLSGDRPKYPNLATATGYGTAGGLMGANCRHSFYPFFEGISENAYKAAELKSYANETVTYNGQKMSVYEATQVQRGIERDIRKWKREAGGLQSAGKDAAPELAKVKEYQAKMRDFIAQMNSQGKPYKWHRQGIREQVDLPKAKAVESAPVVAKASKAVAPTKKTKFTEEKTINGANRYAREVLGLKFAEYKGADIKTANAWNRAVFETFERMPELKTQTKAVGTAQAMRSNLVDFQTQKILEDNKDLLTKLGYSDEEKLKIAKKLAQKSIKKTSSNTYAVSWSKTPNDTDGIFINTEWNVDKLEPALKRDVETGWHPIGTDTIKALVDHEFGHQIDTLIGLKNNSEMHALYKSFSKEEIGNGLSRYAATKQEEFIAEAWSEYLNNQAPRPIAQRVGDLIVKLYNEKHGK